MEGFYLILIAEVAFSAVVSIGLVYFVRKVRTSHQEEKGRHQTEVGAMEDLIETQEKLLDEYRSQKF